MVQASLCRRRDYSTRHYFLSWVPYISTRKEAARISQFWMGSLSPKTRRIPIKKSGDPPYPSAFTCPNFQDIVPNEGQTVPIFIFLCEKIGTILKLSLFVSIPMKKFFRTPSTLLYPILTGKWAIFKYDFWGEDVWRQLWLVVRMV